MDRDEIKNLFMQGIDCSQVVAGAFAKELGMEPDMLRKMAACFGGGMQCGETCGAVTGALMVIGLKYGHSQENDQKTKEEMTQKVAQQCSQNGIRPASAAVFWDMISQNRERWKRCWKRACCLSFVRGLLRIRWIFWRRYYK